MGQGVCVREREGGREEEGVKEEEIKKGKKTEPAENLDKNGEYVLKKKKDLVVSLKSTHI